MSERSSDRGALILFMLSLAVLAFLVGVAVVQYKLPPYGLLQQAKAALVAWTSLEDDKLMTALTRLDPSAPAMPEITELSTDAGDEPLLLTGGFYQDMAECPRFGCLARMIDRTGKTLHKWEVDPALVMTTDASFAGRFNADSIYPIGIALLPEGELAVTFHARNSFPYQVGIARIAVDGSVLWRHFDYSHHWLDADAQGRTYTPSARVVQTPPHVVGTSVAWRCRSGQTFDEGVRIRNADGTVLRDLWLSESLAKSDYPGLLYSVRDGCDPAHVNSVQVVSPAIAETLDGVEAGDLLISAREPSAVAILGGQDGQVRKISIGHTAAQHGPQFLPDGTVVVFDNLGGARTDTAAGTGGSRIVRIDFRDGTSQTIYPKPGTTPAIALWSEDGGHVAVSPDGTRVMVSSKDQSRSFEFDVATGKALWSINIAYDIAPYLALKNLSADSDRGWFNAYGAYYVTELDMAFLQK